MSCKQLQKLNTNMEKNFQYLIFLIKSKNSKMIYCEIELK